MCTMTDGDTYEKTIIFGGITHSKLNSSLMNFGTSKKSKGLVSPTEAKVAPNQNLINSRIEEGSEYTQVTPNLLTGGGETSHLSNDLYVLEVRQIM